MLVVPALAFSKDSNAPRLGHILNLGTASASGAYWPIGKGICDLINLESSAKDLRCVAHQTGGSVYNIQAIRNGHLDIAIVSSNIVLDAYLAKGSFTSWGEYKDLRVIMGLYDQPVSIIINQDMTFSKLSDLEGKNIALAKPGSGQRNYVDLIFKAANLAYDDVEIVNLNTPQMPAAFCDGDVDVVIHGIAHPSQFYREMIQNCEGKLFSIGHEDFVSIRNKTSIIKKITIPKEMYVEGDASVKTFGYQAILVSTSAIPEETIKVLIDTVTENLEGFFNIHPALFPFSTSQLLVDGMRVPIHKGAKDFQSILNKIKVSR